MTGLLLDIRHALRLYRRTPGASIIAVGVLAIGLAFVSAFLSLYVDLVLRPHPGFEDGGDIVTVSLTDGSRFLGVPNTIQSQMLEEVNTLEAAVGFSIQSVQDPLSGENIVAELATRGFFDGLRPRLELGEGFTPENHDAEAELVTVVSYDYWQEELDADPNVIGRTLELSTRGQTSFDPRTRQQSQSEDQVNEFRIIGVMSPRLPGISVNEVRMWLPYERMWPIISGQRTAAVGLVTLMRMVARKRPDTTVEAVIGELESRYEDDIEELGATGMSLDVVDGIVNNIGVQRDAAKQLRVFLAVSVLLALVAACNVSLFLLARAPGRRRELAIRMSVGAPLKRLARQLSREAGVLVVTSAVLGLLLSFWLGKWLRSLAFLRDAEWDNVTLLDWRVLVLVGTFLFVLTILVSLAPILGLRRLGIGSSSRLVAARATLAQRIAGTIQLAIAGTLAGAAIAFGLYLAPMMFGDPGYAVSNRHIATFTPNFQNGINITTLLENFVVDIQRRREALESIPGIDSAAFGSAVPGGGNQNTQRIEWPDRPDEQFEFRSVYIDSAFVETLGLRLVHGRYATLNDVNVAYVNQTFARQYFGRDNVVGESLPGSTTGLPAQLGGGGSRQEIVGVLEDLSFDHPNAEVPPMAFVTGSPILAINGVIVMESRLSSVDLLREIQALTEQGSLELNVMAVNPLSELRSRMISPDRARGFLIMGTAALVVLLAGFGYYGTQRYLVMAGRREYAIRASLGAGPKALGQLVFARGLIMSIPGLAFGIVLAFIGVAWLRDDYVSRDVSPALVTILVTLGLAALLMAASLGPARQARRTEPAPLLRED